MKIDLCVDQKRKIWYMILSCHSSWWTFSCFTNYITFINKIHQSFALHPLSQPNPIQIELIPLSTRFGTKFTSEVDLTNKRLGIGVINGFIGWSTIIKEYWQKSIYWLLPVFFDNDNDYYNTKQIPQKKIFYFPIHRRLRFLIWDRPCSLHYLPQVL